jgi:hypothetical protein
MRNKSITDVVYVTVNRSQTLKNGGNKNGRIF